MVPLSPEWQDSWLRLEDASAIGAARRIATALARHRGFDDDHAGQVAVAVSEAASNLVKHATVGMMLIRPHPSASEAIEVISIDSGPGMADTVGPIRDGYSTAGTLGIGLGAITRLADAYDIHSLPGRGTVLSMRFTPRRSTLPESLTCGLYRPVGEEMVSGDAFAYKETGRFVTALLCDGLGHGIAAAEASREAVRVFQESSEHEPAVIVERTHRALGHTRGGAVAVAHIDRETHSLTYAGIGNVSGWIVTPGARQGLMSVPGIAGHNARRFKELKYDFPPHAVIVMHSDGLTERWDLSSYPGLLRHTAHVIAGTLFRDSAIRRDDASVLVIRTEP